MIKIVKEITGCSDCPFLELLPCPGGMQAGSWTCTETGREIVDDYGIVTFDKRMKAAGHTDAPDWCPYREDQNDQT